MIIYVQLMNVYNGEMKTYRIGSMCLESFPCYHSVTDQRTGRSHGLLDGVSILQLFDKEGVKAPSHFETYRSLLRDERPISEWL